MGNLSWPNCSQARTTLFFFIIYSKGIVRRVCLMERRFLILNRGISYCLPAITIIWLVVI